MSKHEFGIMQSSPEKGKRYDDYEPHKYNCISVDDDCIEKILYELNVIDSYWHVTDTKRKGLAYCGVTLIPPEALQTFISVVENAENLSELRKLCETAFRDKKWIIHFGL